MKRTVWTVVAAFGLVCTAPAEEMKFSQLPNAVQKTVNRNLNGGIVQEVDRKTDGGRTYYDVEIRREGRNKHIRVDADGRLLPRNDSLGGSASVDIDVDSSDNDVFDKNDGKILGVFDNPADGDDFEAEARAGDKGIRVESDLGESRERGITEDLFDKHDGKILDVLPAPGRNDGEVEVEADRDDRGELDAEVDIEADKGAVAVEANEGRGKGIFRKGDGKILGIPIPGRNRPETEVTVDVDRERDRITTDADGGLDTDKGDGRILGVPKRGFETLSLNEVPPVVRETIRREAGGYKIAEIERASVNGRTVYEVDIERGGRNRELHITPEGNILKDSDREAIGAPAAGERGERSGE